jgi:DNA-binding NarL/FixJ family response regulator
MNRKIILLGGDIASVGKKYSALSEDGWEITVESDDSGQLCKKIKDNPPDFILIDLSSEFSHGIKTAKTIMSSKITRDIPVIFVADGNEYAIKVKARFPGADFVNHDNLMNILKSRYM